MMSTNDRARNGARLGPLWFALLGPPVIWAVRFGVSYLLVPFACTRESVVVLLAITLASLLATAAAGAVGWREWRRAGGSTQLEFGGPEARARFMALVGILGSGLFLAVIVIEALAIVFISPCQAGGAPL